MISTTKLLIYVRINGILIFAGAVLNGEDLQSIVAHKNMQPQLSQSLTHQIIHAYTGEKIELEKNQGIVIYVFPRNYEIIWRDEQGKFWQYMGKTPEQIKENAEHAA